MSILDTFNPTRWLIYGVTLLAVVLTIWTHGYYKGLRTLDDYKVAEALHASKIIVKQGKVTEVVRVEYVKQQAKTKVVKEIVEKEVIKYVEAHDDSIELDGDWARLHDIAAAGVSDTSNGTDGTSREAPTAAEALQTVTENYAICNRNTDKLNALQDWVRKQEKATNE